MRVGVEVLKDAFVHVACSLRARALHAAAGSLAGEGTHDGAVQSALAVSTGRWAHWVI